ncbi:hypothetical protein TGGT1_411840, partial [Toxoplasma gondii GT1]
DVCRYHQRVSVRRGMRGPMQCGSERCEFSRFGIRRLWRVAVPHGPAVFLYESRRVPARTGGGGGFPAWLLVDRKRQ